MEKITQPGLRYLVSASTKQSEIFDIRRSSLKKWIEQLPLGSTGESTKLLYDALKKVNKQSNSSKEHLEFLEQIAPILAQLYPRLSKYFSDISLPLTNKTRGVIHVTSNLLIEVLIGYQTIIKQLISQKPFGWKKPFSFALHRAFIYYSQILCTHRLSYTPYPKGMWHEIFWCYQQAENFKLLNTTYPHCHNPKSKTNLLFEFKRMMLLSLLSANELGLKNMHEVHQLMPYWIQLCDILSEEPDDKKSCFTINLLSDVPPYLIGTRNDAAKQTSDRRYLSTQALKIKLTDLLNKLQDHESLRISNHVLSKQTIKALLAHWTRSFTRHEVRKAGSGFVDIATGITAIHFVLSQNKQPVQDISNELNDSMVIDFESTLTIEPAHKSTNKNETLNLGHFLGQSDENDDVWQQVYDYKSAAPPQQDWTETGINKIYQFTKSDILDFSKDGYRLSVNSSEIESIKHNELVAVREHALAPWALAQVKWLHFSLQQDIQFGLRLVSHQVLPVHVRYHTNEIESKPLPCLLGSSNSELMLFVPSLPTDLKNKKVHMDFHDQHTRVKLLKKIITNPKFDAYQIENTFNVEGTDDIQKNTSSMNSIEQDTSLPDNIWNSF